MYERFSGQARLAIQLAAREALRLAHDYVGTEHLLLGVLREGSQGVSQVLSAFGLNRDKTYSRVEEHLTIGSAPASGTQLPFTPAARRALDYAREEAESLHHACIGPEHLLVGLLREPDGNATLLLPECGPTLAALRQELAKLPEPDNRDWQLQPQQASAPLLPAPPTPAALEAVVTQEVLPDAKGIEPPLTLPRRRRDRSSETERALEIVVGQLRFLQCVVSVLIGAVLGVALEGPAGAVLGGFVGLLVARIQSDTFNCLIVPSACGYCGWLYSRHSWVAALIGVIAGLFLAACLTDWRRGLLAPPAGQQIASTDQPSEDRDQQ